MSKKSVLFHIKSNDYFGTVATVLNLIRQTPYNISKNNLIITKIEKDLMFLQKDYKIIKK